MQARAGISQFELKERQMAFLAKEDPDKMNPVSEQDTVLDKIRRFVTRETRTQESILRRKN